jgi:hypothetical protein
MTIYIYINKLAAVREVSKELVQNFLKYATVNETLEALTGSISQTNIASTQYKYLLW